MRSASVVCGSCGVPISLRRPITEHAVDKVTIDSGDIRVPGSRPIFESYRVLCGAAAGSVTDSAFVLRLIIVIPRRRTAEKLSSAKVCRASLSLRFRAATRRWACELPSLEFRREMGLEWNRAHTIAPDLETDFTAAIYCSP